MATASSTTGKAIRMKSAETLVTCTRQEGKHQRRQRGGRRHRPGNRHAARVADCRHAGAKDAGQLVGADQRGRGHVGEHREHGRQLDQPSSANHRIDQTCAERGRTQHPEVHHDPVFLSLQRLYCTEEICASLCRSGMAWSKLGGEIHSLNGCRHDRFCFQHRGSHRLRTGRRKRLGEHIAQRFPDARRALLVTDPGFLRTGLVDVRQPAAAGWLWRSIHR
jgi:hypothetical protein